MLTLALARWRGDLQAVLEAMRAAEAALAAQPASERALSEALSAAALLNLGVAELWSSRLDDARGHLELALELARRAGRPWLQVSPLGHLAIAGPWTGQSCSAGLALAEEAVAIAEAHGWGEDPVLVTGLATGALNLLWLGRLDEAEQWLERAQRTLHPGGEPGSELIVHYARGLLRARAGAARGGAGGARRRRAHGGAARRRARVRRRRARAAALQAQARLGRQAAARALLEDIERARPRQRRHAHRRSRHRAGRSRRANGRSTSSPRCSSASAPALHRAPATVEAQVLDAAAREQLGDAQAAEASLERALDAAEPEGILLPFVLHPLPDVLERLPPAPHGPRDAAPDDPRPAGRRAQLRRPRRCARSSARRSCASCATCRATSRRPRSPPSSPCRPTRSGRTCGTSTPSSTPTVAPRPSSARASSGCSRRPRVRADPKIIENR